MLNNVEVFDECLKTPVPNIDKVAKKILNKIIIPEEKKDNNELLNKNYELIKLINKYSSLDKDEENEQKKLIVNEIDNCLQCQGMNLSPFSQYLMVHDLTHDIYLSNLTFEEKVFVIDSYLEDRHKMYLNHGYSDIIFQVINDNYSHKRKATLGVEKIKTTCKENGIKHFKGDFDDNIFFLLPDNGEKEQFKQALEKYHIKFEFASTHQDKMPDAFIRYKNAFVIIEHKKMKSTGGGQDKQITEIIDFIKFGERGVYYVSYLDGILFNQLINPSTRNKMYRSKQDILKHLENNPFNYFVNEKGFNKLIHNIIKEEQD